jgi:hypothetical protein
VSGSAQRPCGHLYTWMTITVVGQDHPRRHLEAAIHHCFGH